MALQLRGDAGSYLTLATGSPPTGDYTMGCWIKLLTNAPGGGTAFTFRSSDSTDFNKLYTRTSDRLRVELGCDSSTSTCYDLIMGTHIRPYKWFYVQMAMNTSARTLAGIAYQEYGEEIKAGTGGPSGTTFAATIMEIGTGSFNGLISDLRIYNKGFATTVEGYEEAVSPNPTIGAPMMWLPFTPQTGIQDVTGYSTWSMTGNLNVVPDAPSHIAHRWLPRRAGYSTIVSATKVYGGFGSSALGGLLLAQSYQTDWLSNSIKVSLHTASYAPSQDNDVTWTNTNEVTGGTYNSGGIALTNKTVTYNSTTKKVVLDADDVVFDDSHSARYAVIYNAGNAALPVLGYVDFGAAQATGASFTVAWDAGGIFEIAVV